MHIVDTTLFFAPASGGVKRYLLAKRAFLARQPGMRHTIVVPGPAPARAADGVVYVPSPRIPFAHGYRCPLELRRWTRRLVQLGPDLIEAGDPYHLAWAALSAARELDVPAVAFVHSDLPLIAALHCGRAGHALAQWYTAHLYARFDLVTTAGKQVAARLRERGLKRVAEQPLGVDTAIFHPSRRDPAVKAELGLREKTRLLVYAGRLSPEKQVPRLCEMASLLGPRYHLLIVGGSELRTLPHVSFRPYEKDAARLARLIASADALVHAGEHETFGLVLLEAMACGLPVVGVRAGGAGEIVSNAVGRLAEPGSARSLARAVEELFEDDVEGLGRMARRTVELQYGWTPLLRRQLARYLGLMRSRAAQAGVQPAGA